MLETNKVIQGDAIEELKKLSSNSVDCIITDPPYGIDFQSNRRKVKFDKLQGDVDLNWVEPTISEIFRVLKENTHFYCFTRWDVYPFWFNVIKKYFNIKNAIICVRTNHSMGDLEGSYAFCYDICIFAVKGKRTFNKTKLMEKSKSNHARYKGDLSIKGYVTRFPDLIDFYPVNENRYKMNHPTQKSVDLTRFFLQVSSNEKDLVLDPFGGSGTTAVACKQLNRNFILIEISKDYCKIAEERLEQDNLDNFTKSQQKLTQT